MQTLMSTETLHFILKIAGTVVSALVLSGVCVFMILQILHRTRIKNEREHHVRLSNQGNVASVYQLAIFPFQQQDLDPRRSLLGFTFLLNGTPLAEIPADVPGKPVPAPKRAEVKKPSKIKSSVKAKSGLNVKKDLEKKGDAVASTAGAAGTLIGMIGSLLPGSAGKALKEQSGKLRDVQKQTKDVVDKPAEIDRKADTFKKSGERLGVKAPAGTNKSVVDESPAITGEAENNPNSELDIVTEPAPAAPPKRLRASGIPGSVYCVQTPEIVPGCSMTLTLQIKPRKRQFPEYSYPYTLISQQIPLEPQGQETKPVSKDGLVHLKPVASWRYGLRIFSGIFLAAASLSVFAFIFVLIWK